jgi:flavin reductase (DIM6/NTAB) family NADH-FMN oxidoreductase RutF
LIAQAWKCSICGHVSVGLFPPDSCPKCNAPRSAFKAEHEFLFPVEETDGIIKTCWKVSYGLYVVSSVSGERINGQVCNTVFQITSDPPRIAIGINHKNLTHEFIESSGVFAVSILGINDHRIIRRFGYRSGRDFDKFKGVSARRGRTGCPVLEEAIGYIDCTLVKDRKLDAGTHSIFIGDIVGGALLRDEEPITYAYYHATKDTAQGA